MKYYYCFQCKDELPFFCWGELPSLFPMSDTVDRLHLSFRETVTRHYMNKHWLLPKYSIATITGSYSSTAFRQRDRKI